MTYSIPLLTHSGYLAAAGTLVVGIECRLPARYTIATSKYTNLVFFSLQSPTTILSLVNKTERKTLVSTTICLQISRLISDNLLISATNTPISNRKLVMNKQKDCDKSWLAVQSINQSIIYLRTQAAIITWNKGKNKSVQQDRKAKGTNNCP